MRADACRAPPKYDASVSQVNSNFLNNAATRYSFTAESTKATEARKDPSSVYHGIN